jgi:uncharacterized integral membrane protein
MWRLIGFIVVLGIFLVFIGLNLGNRCDICYWFGEDRVIKDVPVYLTAFSSFVLGLLVALPVVFMMRRRSDKARKARDERGPKKPLFGKKKETPPPGLSGDGDFHGENGPYGVG